MTSYFPAMGFIHFYNNGIKDIQCVGPDWDVSSVTCEKKHLLGAYQIQ